MSKIDETLAQEASVYLKDNKHYHEVIRKLRKKYGDVNGQIPGDLKIVKT